MLKAGRKNPTKTKHFDSKLTIYKKKSSEIKSNDNDKSNDADVMINGSSGHLALRKRAQTLTIIKNFYMVSFTEYFVCVCVGCERRECVSIVCCAVECLQRNLFLITQTRVSILLIRSVCASAMH